MEKDKPISEFMDKFDDQWNRVYEMTSGPDRYRQKFRSFVEEDYAKRDFLLAALSDHYPNPVDNLTTKADLSYAEVRYRMQSISSERAESPKSTALAAENSNGKRRRQSGQSQSTTKICTYCKRHGGNAEGHLWNECRKLKKEQKRKKEAAASSEKTQQVVKQPAGFITQADALATSDQMDIDHSEVSHHPYILKWKLDTCASAHMTSDIGLFDRLEPIHGVIRVGGGTELPSEGIGSVLVHAAMLDNSVKNIRVKSVLYVPTLRHSLISWGMLSKQGCVLSASENLSVVYKRNVPIFVAELHDNLPYIREIPQKTSKTVLCVRELITPRKLVRELITPRKLVWELITPRKLVREHLQELITL